MAEHPPKRIETEYKLQKRIADLEAQIGKLTKMDHKKGVKYLSNIKDLSSLSEDFIKTMGPSTHFYLAGQSNTPRTLIAVDLEEGKLAEINISREGKILNISREGKVSFVSSVTAEDSNVLPQQLIDFYKITSKQLQNINFIPEYNYKEFFFTIPSPTGFYRKEDQEKMVKDVINTAKAITTLNDTKVSCFAENSETLELFKSRLKEEGLGSYITEGRIKLELGKHAAEMWAQDLGEPTGGQNSIYLVGRIPLAYGKRREALRGAPTEQPAGKEFVNLPIVLQGGNLTKAVNKEGKKYILVGIDDIRATQEIYDKEHNFKISEEKIKEIYQLAYKADEVLILKSDKDKQPSEMFHIDQSLFPLDDGKVVILKPRGVAETEGDKEIESALKSYEKQLIEAGFEVIGIPTTYKLINEYKAYTNAIAIKTDNKKYLIMPTFAKTEEEKKEEEKNLNEIKSILSVYEVNIIFIENNTFPLQGNLHCITGPLALKISRDKAQEAYT